MEQGHLFTADDKQETKAATTAQESGCVYPGCHKLCALNSVYCPHHVAVVEWEAAKPERRRLREAQLKERRRLEEELLAASPLRVLNPPSSEPPQQKRRAKPRLKSNRRAAFQVEKERIS